MILSKSLVKIVRSKKRVGGVVIINSRGKIKVQKRNVTYYVIGSLMNNMYMVIIM